MSNVEVVLDEHDIKETELESKKTSRKNAIFWYSYDMADTFFSQSVISLAYTPFALLTGYKLGWELSTVFIIMSAFMAGSNLLIAIMGPILGAISDRAGKRKPAVLISAGIMITATAMITIWTNFWWASGLFVIANFCYQAGRMFYDAQIPFIAETEKRGFTQAIGGAIAAFGSVIAIIISIVIGLEGLFGPHDLVNQPHEMWELDSVVLDRNNLNYGGLRWLFLISAIVIILISIPYLFHKEVENPPETEFTARDYMKSALIDFKTSFKAIISDRNSWLFFLAWFFITDAANTTILYMVPVVATMGGESLASMTNYIILGGIIFSIIFGIIVGKLMNPMGPKKLFLGVGISWFIAIVIFVISGLGPIPSWVIWFGAIFIGIGFGGIWIVGRQFIMVLAPPSRLAQYGGFQKIAGRVSAIVSPLMFGGIIFATDHLPTPTPMRLALASLLILFSVGILVTWFIKDPHERYMQGERAPYKGIYDK
ncbi:MAG: MFS transporter [Candidatus Thorarchaeota archaeon]